MSARSTINQRVQAGLEVTPGVAVPATKALDALTFDFGIEANVKFHQGTGKKYPSSQELNQEWTSGTVSGGMDFNALPYLLAAVYGNVTPTNSGGSSIAKDWNYNAVLSGNANPATFTFQKGDASTAEQLSYGLLTQFGWKGARDADYTLSGTLIGQRITTGTTLTASPTAIPLAPIHADQWDVFADDLSTALGTTKIVKPVSIEFSHQNLYNPAWYINTAYSSWAEHLDGVPQTTFKITLPADTQGQGFLPVMRTGATKFFRVRAQGGILDNIQTVSLGGATAGNFTLSYKGQTTANIAFNAAASAVQSALQALSTIGTGNALVTGSAGGPYTVQFTGALAQDATALTGSGSGLTGGTFLVTQSQAFNVFQHDMAVKIGKPDKYTDANGVYAIGYTCQIVEDFTWNAAHKILVTNTLTAL